jgi:hypothetical protein
LEDDDDASRKGYLDVEITLGRSVMGYGQGVLEVAFSYCSRATIVPKCESASTLPIGMNNTYPLHWVFVIGFGAG